MDSVGHGRLPLGVEQGGAGHVGRDLLVMMVDGELEVHAGSRLPQVGPDAGQRDVPKSGSTARVYVTLGEDGGFDALSPNGFALLSPPAGGR